MHLSFFIVYLAAIWNVITLRLVSIFALPVTCIKLLCSLSGSVEYSLLYVADDLYVTFFLKRQKGIIIYNTKCESTCSGRFCSRVQYKLTTGEGSL